MSFFVCLGIVLSLLNHVNGDQIIVAGDSWGEEGWDYLQKVLNSHKNTENLKVKSYASAGTTTADWAKKPDKLLNDVNKNSDAQYIWLTLGGNDAANYLPSCTEKHPYPDLTCIDYILNVMINNTKIILDPVFEQHPNIVVLQFGYDILNFQEGICSAVGRDLIHGCNDEPSCINPQFIKLQYTYIKTVEEYYQKQNLNYTALNLLGTLQMDDPQGRFPNVTVTNPDLNEWSPRQLIQSNCIHPTRPDGFNDIFNEMYNQFWSKI